MGIKNVTGRLLAKAGYFSLGKADEVCWLRLVEYLAKSKKTIEASRLRFDRFAEKYSEIPVVHVVCSGPSLDRKDFDIGKNDVVIACNRSYRYLDDNNTKYDLYYFTDHNVKSDAIWITKNRNDTKVISPFSMFDKNQAGWFYYCNNIHMVEYLAKHHSWRFISVEKQQRCPSGDIFFSNSFFEGCLSYFTVLFGMLQLSAYLAPREVVVYGCDLNYRGVEEKDYALGVYSKDDQSDREGQKFVREMAISLELARDVLAGRGITIINGSERSPLGIFERRA